MSCPEPVIRAREALSSGMKELSILVDNETARDNVERFGKTSGCDVEISENEEGFLLRLISRQDPQKAEENISRGRRATVVCLNSDEIGKGDRELGTRLMNGFLYSCTEVDEQIETVVLLNTGVRLATENDETIAHLKKLEERGTEIVACGTCLDYYGLTDKLRVGQRTNMYEVLSVLAVADRLVSM
jgi:selenium metabolism protein YedF